MDNNSNSTKWKGSSLYSEKYQDIYWSIDNGAMEKYHVFINGNLISERIRNNEKLVIFEFGFGAGINFFLTLDELKKSENQSNQIHYFSIEKFPPSLETLNKLISHFPDLKNSAKEFINIYKIPPEGIHRYYLENSRFTLDLLIGDVSEFIDKVDTSVDAWYLDGFSPRKNTELWSKEIFQFMAAHSHSKTTLSTYTVSKSVREGLAESGFELEKKDGFGMKKSMLTGNFAREEKSKAQNKKPFFSTRSAKCIKGKAIVIGGSLAGSNIAYALNRRGWKATIIEKAKPEGILDPYGMYAPALTAEKTPLSSFTIPAFHFLNRQLDELKKEGRSIRHFRTGTYEITSDEKEAERQIKALDFLKLKGNTSDFLETLGDSFPESIQNYSGLYYPDGGYLNAIDYCKALCFRDGISFINGEVSRISQENGKWIAYSLNNSILEYSDIIIFANSYDISNFPQIKHIPIKKTRGQICYLPASELLIDFNHVILHDDGYFIPNIEGFHIVGSTYNPNDSSNALNPEHNVLLLERLKKLFPAINPELGRTLNGRVGFRVYLPDRMPTVGPVHDYEYFMTEYSDLWKANQRKQYMDAKYIDGLYILTGLGSRGILSSPLLSEILVSIIEGSPLPVDKNLYETLHPSRFLIKDICRRKV